MSFEEAVLQIKAKAEDRTRKKCKAIIKQNAKRAAKQILALWKKYKENHKTVVFREAVNE